MKTVAIVLNGASSAGKTSIARALQRLSKIPVLHASLDTFTDMFHWAVISDVETRRECHRTGVANFHAALPILTASRFPVVVDHVFEQHAWFEACREALGDTKTYFVGVRCPLEVLIERERARGDRRIGLAQWQYERVHDQKSYDFEVDTSQPSPEECAAAIIDFVTKPNDQKRPITVPTACGARIDECGMRVGGSGK